MPKTRTQASIEQALTTCQRLGLEKAARAAIREIRQTQATRCQELILQRLPVLLTDFKQDSLF